MSGRVGVRVCEGGCLGGSIFGAWIDGLWMVGRTDGQMNGWVVM